MSNPKFHITANSNEVRPGSIFFALKGAKHDGHDFIQAAIDAGATTIYSERTVPTTGNAKIIVCGNAARKKLGELASEAFGQPTHSLKMIGITGTSGKTTTSYLIEHILNSCGFSCARIGTNGTSFQGKEIETSNTTPDAITLQNYFADVLSQGATHVVMEVSSHALDQDRVWGITWDAVTFLNLSPEHMDYHPTLENYFEVKSRLFLDHSKFSKAHGKSPRFSANLGSPYGVKLSEPFASKKDSDFQGFSIEKNIKNLKPTSTGISAQVIFNESGTSPRGTPYELECPLFGTFQIENILAALRVCNQLQVPLAKAIDSLKTFPGVPGRMESISNTRGIYIFVDYAHKPEALEKVLRAIQPVASSTQKIITVFGCGGDRDKTKRPVMGTIAAKLSHELILTSDNPRTENPLQILAEIEAGVKDALSTGQVMIKNYSTEPDRAIAIHQAIHTAKTGDIVLIAGKGHESYQIFGTEKRHFDDREEARKALI